MARNDFFTLRVDQNEREKLAALADRFRRSQSGVIRILIDEAYKQVDAETKPENGRGVQHAQQAS